MASRSSVARMGSRRSIHSLPGHGTCVDGARLPGRRKVPLAPVRVKQRSLTNDVNGAGMTGILTRVDDRMRSVAHGVQEYFTLAGRAIRFVIVRPFYWRDTLTQMDRMGVGSVPILLLTGLFTGMVLTLQSGVALQRFGADMYVGNLVAA